MGLAFGVRPAVNVVLVLPLVAWSAGFTRGIAAGRSAVSRPAPQRARWPWGRSTKSASAPRIRSATGPPPPRRPWTTSLRPALVGVAAIGIGVLLVARWARRRWWTACSRSAWVWERSASAQCRPLRLVAGRMVATTASTVLNATIAGAGWDQAGVHAQVDGEGALLVCAPFLVLGARRSGGLLHASSAAVADGVGLDGRGDARLSVGSRPRSRTPGRGSAMGFMSLSPRYLVDLIVPLYVLAWRQLRGVRIGGAWAVVGAAVGDRALRAHGHRSGRFLDVPEGPAVGRPRSRWRP